MDVTARSSLAPHEPTPGWRDRIGLAKLMRMHGLLLAAFALELLGRGAPAGTGTLTLDELLRHMSSTRGVVAEFRETKTLALLDGPLEARGTLYFQPPDRFARVTREPAVTRLVLVGSRMRFEDATGVNDVDLA